MQKRLSLTLAALALCAGAAYGTGVLAQSSSGGGSYGGSSGSGSGSATGSGQMNSGNGGMSTSPSTGGSSGSSAGNMGGSAGSTTGSSGTGRTLTMAQAEQAGLTSAQFSALDTNHDGVLDEQELAKGGYRFRSGG